MYQLDERTSSWVELFRYVDGDGNKQPESSWRSEVMSNREPRRTFTFISTQLRRPSSDSSARSGHEAFAKPLLPDPVIGSPSFARRDIAGSSANRSLWTSPSQRTSPLISLPYRDSTLERTESTGGLFGSQTRSNVEFSDLTRKPLREYRHVVAISYQQRPTGRQASPTTCV